jgi:CheY-like chemotaxis protein
VVGVAQDVTEDRKHEEELRDMHALQAAQEAKVETERNMTAYFAHELRNPLSAIDSALMAMPDDIPESAKTLINGMQLCTTFMSSIMNNLLDVRKMEEGKMTLKGAPTCLPALLSRVRAMLHPSVKPGVAFEIQCNTNGRDWAIMDEHRVQQVLTNVVTNAMKYTIAGSITLRVEWEDDMVKFECIDTGPGIPKKEQEKLFQRFVQRGGAPGTGLGLVIAKHLVDLMSGSIRFESDPTIKAGTSCIVNMKLTPCSSLDVDTEVEVAATMIEEPLRILIIDDLKINRSMLSRRIRKTVCPSCNITEAATGEQALETCKDTQFDVVIVDQYMEEAGGVMVGTDVVYALRRMKVDAIIIGCSGNDLCDEFTQAGADCVWQKPLPSNSRIISQLRQFLENKKPILKIKL